MLGTGKTLILEKWIVVKFAQLVDVGELQALCEAFTEATGAVTAILELDGEILVASGWQDICTKFHRQNPGTVARCHESDTILASKLSQGEAYNVYECKNGLVDVAVPIKVGGEHVANLFTGQFFLSRPDEVRFVRQAKEFGLDRKGYLDALKRTPIFQKEKVQSLMGFLTKLAQQIGEMGLNRKNLHDANRRLQEFATLVNSTDDAIVSKTPNGIISGWNPAAARLFGYSASEAIGQYHSLVVPRDDYEAEEDKFRRLLQGEVVPHYVTKRRRKDGSEIYVSISKSLNRDGDGSIVSISQIMRDITDRVIADQALANERKFLRTLIDTLPDLIWLKDPDGVYLRCNKEFEKFFGASETEIVGKTDYQFVDQTLADFFRAHDRTAMESDSPSTNEEIVKYASDGHEACLETTKVPMHASDGTLIGVLGVAHDITERKLAEETTKQLAFFDPLTNLPNRRLMVDRLQQALIKSARDGQCGALLLIDLDNFKAVNDTRGHDVGDRLLIDVASRLGEAVRKGDTVSRIGGDEFIVILESLGESEVAPVHAETIADAIRTKLGLPYQLKSTADNVSQLSAHKCTPSIGIAVFHGTQHSPEELMKRADTAMYQAKATGRNTVRFFDPKMQEAVEVRVRMESELREAIFSDQLRLYLQPQVDKDGQVIGAEALIRWIHPEQGFIPPGQFIPIAEDTGLIYPIGHWVLKEACQLLAKWRREPTFDQLVIAVNISPRQIALPNFVEETKSILDTVGALPNQLKLEITESLLHENMEATVAQIKLLRNLKIKISMDDFGTGYSSLSYLKRLPLDQLKIDQAFVRDILSDTHDAAIAKTIIGLAQSLDLDVIAEGVETQEQRDLLNSIGCLSYQGYFYGRPMPVSEFQNWVKANSKLHRLKNAS